MIDYEKIYKKYLADKFFKKYVDKEQLFSDKFKRGMKWYAYKFIPALMKIGSFIAIVFAFSHISNKYGFERIIIIGIVAILFSLGSLKNEPDS